MDQVAVPVGIQSDKSSPGLELAGDLLDGLEPERGFPVTAENNLQKWRRVSYGFYDLIHGWFMLQPQVVTPDHGLLLAVAEYALRRAPVREVYIEARPDLVDDPCFA